MSTSDKADKNIGELINIVVGLGIQDINQDASQPILFSPPTVLAEQLGMQQQRHKLWRNIPMH